MSRFLSSQSKILQDKSRALTEEFRQIVAHSKEVIDGAKAVLEAVNRDIARCDAQSAQATPRERAPESFSTPPGEPSPAVLPRD
jgi:vacuolar-type H+-ATPase subunit D/Vma8